MLLSRIVAKRQENVGQQFIQKILDCDSPQEMLQILQNPHNSTSLAIISNCRELSTGNTILQVVLSKSATPSKKMATATTTSERNTTTTTAVAAAAALSSRIWKNHQFLRHRNGENLCDDVDKNTETKVHPVATTSADSLLLLHPRTQMVPLFQIVEYLIHCTDPELKEDPTTTTSMTTMKKPSLWHDHHGSQYHHSLIQIKNEINGELPLHTACRYSFQRQWEILSSSTNQETPSSTMTIIPTEQTTVAGGGGHSSSRSRSSFSSSGGVQWLDIVQYLIQSYPVACQTPDTAGNLPIHHACANVAQLEILLCLVQQFPEAVKITNAEESLPVHLAAAAASFLLPNTTIDNNNNNNSTTTMSTLNSNQIQNSDTRKNEGIKSWSSFEVHRSYSEEEFDTVDLAQQAHTDNSPTPSPIDVAKLEAQNRQRRRLFQSQQLEIVQFLVDYWPESIYKTNKHGETPLQAARNADAPNYPLIEFLRDFEEHHAPPTHEIGGAATQELSLSNARDGASGNLEDSSLACSDTNSLHENVTVNVDNEQQKDHPQIAEDGDNQVCNDAEDEDTFVTAANLKVETSLDVCKDDMIAAATEIEHQNTLEAATNHSGDICFDDAAEKSFIGGEEDDNKQASDSSCISKEENTESFITNVSIPIAKVYSTDNENDAGVDARAELELQNNRPTLTGIKLRNVSLDTLDTELDDSFNSSSSKVDLIDVR